MTAAAPNLAPTTAKVFITGRSQAVRLPKAFRFATSEVTIERQGDAVILRPKLDNATWAQQVLAAVAAFDSGFKLERADEWPQSDREPLLP
ncbi:MAG: AbrB/MazE/SpoVT family DNA-binding domain-containing protein [Candidatus Saccharibacteria bacterium]|nr:AbrB/MazE/SpoVT family DNA-binding domain-containing protein [Rhodoferax sp.]